VPTIQEWTADQVEGGKVVGVDPSIVTAADARKLAEKIKKKGGEYRAIDENLIDLVWGAERPARPSEKVIVQPVEYSGKSFDDKIEDLRKELEKKKSLGFVVSMLDETAWLFNLRGNEYDSCLPCRSTADGPQHTIQPRLLFLRSRHPNRRHNLRQRKQAARGRQEASGR
jgi:hypothetical protein